LSGKGRKYTLGKMPNGKSIDIRFRGDHLTIDTHQLSKNEKSSDRFGYNNFFNTKQYNIFNCKDKQKDEIKIENTDQINYLSQTIPRGFRNINFNSYSKRPSIVSKKQQIHEKRFDSFDLKPQISTKSVRTTGIQFEK